MLRDVIGVLIVSFMGGTIGIVAFCIFFIAYNNLNTGFWSILSGILAVVCFHLHWVKGRETLETWHTKNSLRFLHAVGFLSAAAGYTAIIWYLFLTFYYKIPLIPMSQSTIISAVWSMICAKWGIILMYHSHEYELAITVGNAPLIPESNP